MYMNDTAILIFIAVLLAAVLILGIVLLMVREDKMRYRDFAVITGDLPSYGSIVRQVFSEEDIPFFIDEKRALIHNPFVEYLRAALEACTENYSYDSIFGMLKTGMRNSVLLSRPSRRENPKRIWKTSSSEPTVQP